MSETDEQEQPRKCFVCGRRTLDATELQTCVHCINTTRRQLQDVVDMYALLPGEIAARAGTASPMDPTGTRSSETPMPGGDALVMLAGGSGRRHYDDATSVDSIVGSLALWEDDWREHFGVEAARVKATLSSVTAYLFANLARAAQWHPAFDEFAREVRQHQAALQRVTSRGEATDRGAPCPYCGARIIRRFDDADRCDPIWVPPIVGMGYPPYLGYGPFDGRPGYWKWCDHAGHAESVDQGGRREVWVCSNRECSQLFDERKHRFAIWQAHAEREPTG